MGAQLQVQSPRSYGCIGRVPRVVDAFAGQYGAAGYFCNVVAGKVVTNPGFATINDAWRAIEQYVAMMQRPPPASPRSLSPYPRVRR